MLDPEIGTRPHLIESDPCRFQPLQGRPYPRRAHNHVPTPRGTRLRSLARSRVHPPTPLRPTSPQPRSRSSPPPSKLPSRRPSRDTCASNGSPASRSPSVAPGTSSSPGATAWPTSSTTCRSPPPPSSACDSTQKLLTATAVLRLAELGRLRLDDPVQHDCPAFGVRPWPVTVGDLLTHQGGVRPSDLADLFNRQRPPVARGRGPAIRAGHSGAPAGHAGPLLQRRLHPARLRHRGRHGRAGRLGAREAGAAPVRELPRRPATTTSMR